LTGYDFLRATGSAAWRWSMHGLRRAIEAPHSPQIRVIRRSRVVRSRAHKLFSLCSLPAEIIVYLP
jgi:hypothetical protein